MVECDGHHYPKYMSEDTNWVSTYFIYKQRYEKLWYICVLRIVMQGAWGCGLVVECLPSMHGALGSILSTT